MKDFKQYYIINATPEFVYLALTKEDTLMLWTGYPAVMKEEEGTEFALWDNNIVGKNLLFEKNKKIVQHWYFGEQPEDSIVTFILHSHKKGTSIELRHTNIPDEAFEDMQEGWNNAFMGSLQSFYEEG